MAIEPYLFFNGRCEEAIEFYKKALGRRGAHADALQRKPGTAAAGNGAAGLGE